jgi:hypothetical protein
MTVGGFHPPSCGARPFNETYDESPSLSFFSFFVLENRSRSLFSILILEPFDIRGERERKRKERHENRDDIPPFPPHPPFPS